MSFKIAYGAGHFMNTGGRRIPKELDPSETREWVLNDRVADYFAEAAAEYEDVELLRVDDPAGRVKIEIEDRVKAANEWGADFCLAIHHNAAGVIFSGGGVVAYIAKKHQAITEQYQKEIYNSVIAAGGIRGNRSDPMPESNLYVCTYTKAPCVLMECGFMDSKVDAQIIKDPAYSKKIAYGMMEGIAKVGGLKKKEKAAPAADTIYRVQIGAFRNKAYAEAMLQKAKAAGFTDAYIKEG